MRYRFRAVAVAVALAVVATIAPSYAGGLPVYDDLALAPLPARPPLPKTHTAVLVRDALSSANTYFLNTWWTENMAFAEPVAAWSDRLLKRGTINSEHIRRYSSVALSLAAPLSTGTYDGEETGIPMPLAGTRVADLVGLIVRTHIANVPDRAAWGDSWQSALWASQAALAGWLLGDLLAASDRVLLARMLAFEADAVTEREIHYLRDRNGKLVTHGDSGAEELAWDAVAELTAVELLPRHPRRVTWAEDSYRRLIAAYSLPSDTRSTRSVHGKTLRTWLRGSNLEPSGWVVNHGKLNPDYTVGFSLHGAIVPGLAGTSFPAAVLHNEALMYRNLVSYKFTAPWAFAPGGTVYVPNSAKIYYPRGVDWGPSRQVLYAALDVEAAALGLDRGLKTPARTWAVRHLQEVRRQQRRFETGQMYGPREENTYFAREEHAGALLAYAHLADALGAANRLRVSSASASAKRP